MSKRTRRRRGNPKGKALGFRAVAPATSSSSSSGSSSGASAPSAPSAPSATQS
jgi:hypothetical protein